jgi:hypothetical protein
MDLVALETDSGRAVHSASDLEHSALVARTQNPEGSGRSLHPSPMKKNSHPSASKEAAPRPQTQLTIESHVLDVDGSCARCRKNLIEIPFMSLPAKPIRHGDRIGVIDGLRFTQSPAAYVIRDLTNDSNKPCEGVK